MSEVIFPTRHVHIVLIIDYYNVFIINGIINDQ